MISFPPPAWVLPNKQWWERISFDRNWLIAVSGVIFGAVMVQVGMRVEGGAIAVLSFAPLYLSLERRLFPGLFFGPLTFMYVYHANGYAVGPLGQMFVLGHLIPEEQGFVPAQWGGVLGLAVFAVLFYQIFPVSLKWFQGRWNRALPAEQDRRWRAYVIVLTLTGIAVLGYGLVSGASNRLGGEGQASISSSSLVSALAAVSQVMFFFLGFLAVRRGKGWILFWVFMLAGYSLFSFLDGGRGAAAFAAIFSAMGFAWAGASRRKIILAGAVAASIFIPLSDVVLTYRGQYADLTSKIAFRDRVTGILAAAEAFKSESGGSLPLLSEGFLDGITAHAVDQVFLQTPGSIPFVGLEGIGNVVWVFIPTLLYPERPDLNDGNSIAIQYDTSSLESSRGAYMPAVGDGYRRGGWTGVALLYAFSALIYGPVLALCWARRTNVEWMAMLVWLSFQAAGIWSTTMLTNFWLLLWAFPRQWLTFWLLRHVQRIAWAMGHTFFHLGNYRTKIPA